MSGPPLSGQSPTQAAGSSETGSSLPQALIQRRQQLTYELRLCMVVMLVGAMPASLRCWPLCREESCSHPEALASYDRLPPPAWAQGIGTSCRLDRSSQGSPRPRSPEETHAFLSDTRRIQCLPSLVSGGHSWSSPCPSTASASVLIPRDTVIVSPSSGPTVNPLPSRSP